MRSVIAALLVLHGVAHLLGVVKAFAPAALAQLQPIPWPGGVAWAGAAGLFVAAGVAAFRGETWWWLAGIGVGVSMFAIVPSWRDAWAGALVNAAVLVAVAGGIALDGPLSLRAAYERDAALALGAQRAAPGPIHADDLSALPPPLRRYLELSGVVGQPRVRSLAVRMHGRIRQGPTDPWMPLAVRQISVLDPPARLFYFDSSVRGVATPGYHRFAGGDARMVVKVLGVVPVAQGSGPAMTRSETVTFLNDLCVLAPAALVDAPIRWTAVDAAHVHADYTLGPHTVGAVLAFGADGRLADFWSDDRDRAGDGATVISGQRWSTPIDRYGRFGALTLPAHGVARWHDPAGTFDYIELAFDAITINPRHP